jgi:O-antigen/teichoic acid export membrane protein
VATSADQDQLLVRLRKGTAGQGVYQLAIIVVQTAGVPIFLAAWGVQLYGEWLTLFAIPGYLAISDIGFTTAATNSMAMSVAEGKRQKAHTTFKSSWLTVTSVSAFVLACTTIIAWSLPVRTLLNLSVIGDDATVWIIFLLGLQAIGSMQTGLLYAGFVCEGHYGVGMTGLGGVHLFENALVAGWLTIGGGPVGAAAALSTGRFLGNAVLWLLLRRRSPWLFLRGRKTSYRDIRELLTPALASGAFPVGNAMSLQGVTLVLGNALGPVTVAAFSTIRTFTRFGMQILRAVVAVISPEVSAAFGRGDRRLLRELHRRATQLSLWLAGITLAGMAVLGPTIIDIWTGGRIIVEWPLLYLLLGVVLVNASWFTSLSVLYATNNHQRVAAAYLLATTGALTAAYFTAEIVGVNGVACALIGLEIVMAAVVLRASLRFVDDTLRPFLAQLVRPPTFAISVLSGGGRPGDSREASGPK